MQRSSRLHTRFIVTVGRAFLLEMLYGSKYTPHVGTYNMPFLYVKTVLMCASAYGLEKRESRYLHGLVECLLPSTVSQDNLTKLELLQFVDAVPASDNTEWMAEEERRTADRAAHTHCAVSVAPRGTSSPSFLSPTPEHVPADAFAFLTSSTFPSLLARLLVYDAVAACVADSLYSASERERVALVASQVGLSTAEREQIERTALQERALSVRKRRLLCLTEFAPRESATLAGAVNRSGDTTSSGTPTAHDEDEGFMTGASSDLRHVQQAQTRAYVEGLIAPGRVDGGPGSSQGEATTHKASLHAALTTGPAARGGAAVTPRPMTRQEALRILRCRSSASGTQLVEDGERCHHTR